MNFFQIKAMVTAIKLKNLKKTQNEKNDPGASPTSNDTASENTKLHKSRQCKIY